MIDKEFSFRSNFVEQYFQALKKATWDAEEKLVSGLKSANENEATINSKTFQSSINKCLLRFFPQKTFRVLCLR